MKVLIACEFSGIVRDAFIAKGHDAMSCDLLPTEKPGPHYQGDVMDIIHDGWDMMIAHPPCTFLTVSGNRWFSGKQAEIALRYYSRLCAAEFFFDLALSNIHKIAIENPIGVMSGFYRKPDQVIQPWMFGHGETKATCLWLKNLQPLTPTHNKNDFFTEQEPEERVARVHMMPPGPDRWKERSRTFTGIAQAMADQWGVL